MIDMIVPDKVVSSPVNVGSGTVRCAHGILPVPAPATLELLKSGRIPVYSEGKGELTTPTGALLLAVFAESFGSMPAGIPKKIGYGLGKMERETPNVLRAVLLDSGEVSGDEKDRVAVLEANIDDMNPQIYEAAIESLMKKGALDVFLTPIIMKKSRPAVKLTCIAPLEKKRELLEAILKETTTIGVRYYDTDKLKLKNNVEKKVTPFGEISVKVASLGDRTVRVMPEYESVREIAEKHGIPVLQTYFELLGFLNKEKQS